MQPSRMGEIVSSPKFLLLYYLRYFDSTALRVASTLLLILVLHALPSAVRDLREFKLLCGRWTEGKPATVYLLWKLATPLLYFLSLRELARNL